MKKTTQTLVFAMFTALCLCGMSFAGGLPDTGQTKCYNDTAEIACPAPGQDFYGQDAQYSTNPRSYTKLDASGNALSDSATAWAMVRDNVTGLIWEMKTDDGSVHDKDNTYNWNDAQTVFIAALNSVNFGGYSDWRLPNIKELASILDLGKYLGEYAPLIDNVFLYTNTGAYWTSTPFTYSPNNSWCVGFGSIGSAMFTPKFNSFFVRAVRGIGSGNNHFINNGNGTITDTEIGLIWQEQSSDSQINWKNALSYCENLSLADYNDWRLPSQDELRSIVDYGKYGPAIDSEYFPSTLWNGFDFIYYWSATTCARDSDIDKAWSIEFSNGYDGPFSKFDSHHARCVRGGITPQTHTLTTNITPSVAGNSISRSPDKSAYDHNESVTLTAVPDACYNFTGWSGACSGTSPTCTLTMDSDKSVTANFAVKTYSLTVTASNGSVSKNPSASSYNCGTVVSLTAVPNTGWHFVRWEGDVSGTSTSASVTMTANRNVTAVFEMDIPNTYTESLLQ